MKTIISMTTIATTMLMTTLTQATVPDDYSMHCWDHSFAYNMLDVRKKGNVLNFEARGAGLYIADELKFDDNHKGFGSRSLSVSVPLEDCQISEVDQKILLCHREDLVLKKINSMGDETSTPVNIEYGYVEIRKVTTIGNRPNSMTTGYELHIGTNLGGSTQTLIQQKYFNRNLDETNNCTLLGGLK